MVVEDFGDSLGLVFRFDRNNEGQSVHCVGPELWEDAELDFDTLDLASDAARKDVQCASLLN